MKVIPRTKICSKSLRAIVIGYTGNFKTSLLVWRFDNASSSFKHRGPMSLGLLWLRSDLCYSAYSHMVTATQGMTNLFSYLPYRFSLTAQAFFLKSPCLELLLLSSPVFDSIY